MKPLGDYFDGILLVFNYRAAIEGEQQLSPAFEGPLHVLPGGVYECYQKVALCATSDSMPEVGKVVEETGRDEANTTTREKERERETAKDKRRLRENPEGENFIVTTIALNLGTLRATLAAAPTHEEFHYKSQVGQAPRGPA